MAWIDYQMAYGMVLKMSEKTRMSENVQNIQQSRKFNHKSHERLGSGINSRRINSSRSKNPKRCLPGRLTHIIFVCYSNDAPQLHTEEMHWALQIYEITRKV